MTNQRVIADNPVETLSLLLAATNEGVIDHNLSEGTCRYSGRWFRMLGYEPENTTDAPAGLWLEWTLADDREELERLWKDHVDDGWPFDHTWRMVDRFQRTRWIRCRSVARLDDSGTPERAYSLFDDVTESVETGLRHLALIQAIPDTIVRLTAAGALLDVRPAAGNPGDFFEGVGAEDAIDQVGPDGFAAWVLASVRRALDSQALVTSAFQFDDGQTVTQHIEGRTTPIGQSEAVMVLRNVTEQRQLESQLAQAQKLESIGQLAAGIAHEINTPLQYIGDNAKFMERVIHRLAPVLDAAKEAVESSGNEASVALFDAASRKARVPLLFQRGLPAAEACVEGVKQVAEIVSAMKAFSHMGSDSAEPANMNDALRNTVKVARNEWKNHAEIEFEFDEHLPPILCFPAELNQCFLNIIVNAAHALAEKYPAGQRGTITLRTATRDDGVVIEICDDGPGMPEHVRSRIFDPFFTTKEVGKGTGQGLAIARRTICDKHGGELNVQTKMGQGTTFELVLPLEVRAEPSESTE